MYGCENWTIKKAECQRINVFELWCWRRPLRVPWTTWRSNQSILKEISPEYSLEGLMLKLKLQYFGHLMGRTDSLEKILMLGKIKGRRRRGWQKMKWLDGITDLRDMSFSKLRWCTGSLACCSLWSHRVGHDWATGLNWSEHDYLKRFKKKTLKFNTHHTQHTRYQSDFLQLVKGHLQKPTANVIINGERLNAFTLRSGVRQEHQFLPFLFNIMCACSVTKLCLTLLQRHGL